MRCPWTSLAVIIIGTPAEHRDTVDGQNPAPPRTKDDDYPIIYRVLTIPGGAGFLPSTVPCLFSLQGDHAEISWTPFQPDVTLAVLGLSVALPTTFYG